MKYKNVVGRSDDRTKRRSKTNLTRGAFGNQGYKQCRTVKKNSRKKK